MPALGMAVGAGGSVGAGVATGGEVGAGVQLTKRSRNDKILATSDLER